MSTEMAQMNTRISRSLKERGDAALEKAGMTPSQAVRKLKNASYAEMREYALMERLRERGLDG